MKLCINKTCLIVPSLLISFFLIFTAPASAADYTATASQSCSLVSGVYEVLCNSVTVSLPSDKTWVSVSVVSGSSGSFVFNKSKQTLAMGGGPMSGKTVTYNFILTDEDGDTYTFAVTVSYS